MEPFLPPLPIAFSAHLGEGHLVQAFDLVVATRQLHHVRRAQFSSSHTSADALVAAGLRLEASADTISGHLVLARSGDHDVIELQLHGGVAALRVAATEPVIAESLISRIRDMLTDDSPRDAADVPIWFWTMGDHAPHALRRRLTAPAWDDIARNYSHDVRTKLDALMHAEPSTLSGISVWRGEPGTGKTTALRALARAWSPQCEMHVIVDPEVFLGDNASYLLDVLFGTATQRDEHGQIASEQPMRLIVLEDAGDLIADTAREHAGQALSRLLNVSDGMLGQGSNVGVIVTTNEPMEDVHPAITRAGRGRASIPFVRLTETESAAWLAAHGASNAPARGEQTIAELYAMLAITD